MNKITGVQTANSLSISRKTNKFSRWIRTTFKDENKTSSAKRSRNLQSPLVYNLFLYASFARGEREQSEIPSN